MRSGNYHARGKSFAAHQPRHSRRCKHTGGDGFGAPRAQTSRNLCGDVRPGLARVAAEQHAWLRTLVCGRARKQKLAQNEAEAFERRVIQRIGARNSADAIRAEKLFCHLVGISPLAGWYKILASRARGSRRPPPHSPKALPSRALIFARPRAVARVRSGELCYRTRMPVEETKVVSSSSVSSRIIAAGIVIAFCYWASTILVTLLVAVLLAYFLDPVVTWMERMRIPRALGSLIVVLVTIAILAVMGYSLIARADQFSADWPKYRAPLQSAVQAVESRMESVESHVSEIASSEKPGQKIVAVGESHTVRDLLVGRLNSLYEFVLAATFIPFLLFFMLAAKRQVWHATMQLFAPGERTAVRDALAEVTQVLRSYLMGTALVGLILIFASWLFFWGLGLDFPFLTGLVSGICNLVPYLGVIMSWVPPL